MTNQFCSEENYFWCSNENKPLEIYLFVDPLCSSCWALESIIKKLYLEYGDCFRLKHVIGGNLKQLNKIKKNSPQLDSDNKRKPYPYLASIAVKAAELQGTKAGLMFLRRLHEMFFLSKANIAEEDTLLECARSIGLDSNEFIKDLHSESAAKAFQCDLKIVNEMDISEVPSIVVFNERIEDEGLKVTGVYDYEIYVQILHEMLETTPEPRALPSLTDFLSKHKFIHSAEISMIYDKTVEQTECTMKKLALQQKVEKVPGKYGNFWKVIHKK